MKRAASNKKAPAKDVDDYLASIPEDSRAALENLRRIIRAVVPKATEVISYQIPTFRHQGALVAFAAFKNHCSFFVMSLPVIEAYKDELKRYDTAKATIHFTADRPLPASLVKKLVKARIEENKARAERRES